MSDTDRLADLVQRVQVVAVEPNDICIITVPHAITMEEAERMQDMLAEHLPQQRILIVTEASLAFYREPSLSAEPGGR